MSLNYFRAWSVASARSTLERAPTVPVSVDVWPRIHCKSGITLRYMSKDAALAVIILHALMAVRKGDPVKGWTKASRAMVVLQNVLVSDATASSMSQSVPGPIYARAASISTVVGAGTSCTASQSRWTSM